MRQILSLLTMTGALLYAVAAIAMTIPPCVAIASLQVKPGVTLNIRRVAEVAGNITGQLKDTDGPQDVSEINSGGWAHLCRGGWVRASEAFIIQSTLTPTLTATMTPTPIATLPTKFTSTPGWATPILITPTRIAGTPEAGVWVMIGDNGVRIFCSLPCLLRIEK